MRPVSQISFIFLEFSVKIWLNRMHSSRMHTGRALIVCLSLLLGEGVPPSLGGWGSPSWGVYFLGGSPSLGGLLLGGASFLGVSLAGGLLLGGSPW